MIPKGHRFILLHSKVLIHEPLISKGFGGSATNIEKTAQRILDVKTQMNTLFAKHTGKTIDEINEATAYDHLMTAEEAISFGMILSIILDTLTARILKLRSDSQSRIEPMSFYSRWEPTDYRADSAVAP